MRSRLTARAEATSEIISWLALVVGGLILIVWLFKSGALRPTDTIEELDKDILQVQIMLDEACTTMEYRNSYNPLMETGIINVTGNELCITLITDATGHITRCAHTVCNLSLPGPLDLANITDLIIRRDGGAGVYVQ
jgi:hypothetical protein